MFDSVQELASNSFETFLSSSEILLRYAQNILDHPLEPKYRKVRVGNKHVTTLLEVPGAMQCLFDMGFEEDGEYFTLSLNTPLQNIRKIKEELLLLKKNLSSSKPETKPDSAQQNIAVNHNSISASNIAQLRQGENEIEARIRASFSHVLVYQSKTLQDKARSLVPRSDLMKKAEDRINAEGLNASWLRDRYLLELLDWFKSSFFKWVDTLACESCGGTTVIKGALAPNEEELQNGGSRVENHFCTLCSSMNRFPRYNNPGRLLETRRGRCGEWANCFTLICIAEGFEARHVFDWADHVWTEVYSEIRGERWIHVDPCENIADRPLLYEIGWGKQLNYVIAFAVDDIQDVTWRYVSQHAAALERRKSCREEWLVNLILRLRADRQRMLAHNRRRLLVERTVSELVEFLLEPHDSESGLGGRTTGSEEWRRARGEMGSGSCSVSPAVSVTIKPTSAEAAQKLVSIKYDCALDHYLRGSDTTENSDEAGSATSQQNKHSGEIIKGWQALAFESKNIARKVENDWKKAYLARSPGGNNKPGSIEWKFDFSEAGLVVDWLLIEFTSECFKSGRVDWRLCGDEQCVMLNSGHSGSRLEDLDGSTVVHITAEIFGGEGNEAWQHAQLFRQSTDDSSPAYPFTVTIKLKHAS